MKHYYKKYSGLALIFITLIAFFAHLGQKALIYHSWGSAWQSIYVYFPYYIWGDLHVILHPLACFQNGNVNFTEPACHGDYAVYNYPILWLKIVSALNITEAQVNAIALGMAVTFYGTAVWLFRHTNIKEGIIAALALISPPVIFVIQRANCEEIIFELVVWACLLWEKRSRLALFFRLLLVLMAALLKLYPFLVLVLFFLDARSVKERVLVTLTGLVFAVYSVLNLSEIAFIQAITLRGVYPAFGVNVLPEQLPLPPYLHDLLVNHRLWVQLGLGFAALLYVFGTCLKKRDNHVQLAASLKANVDAVCFGTGASVYVCMFFAQSHNWDYRLIFLIICLPQTFNWMRTGTGMLKKSGKSLTIYIMLTLWMGNFIPLLDELCNWILGLTLAVIMLEKSRQAFNENILGKPKIIC